MNRRYSSTAVGFPIHNDQKPLAKAVCDTFPSCTPAHRHALMPTHTDTETPPADAPKNQ